MAEEKKKLEQTQGRFKIRGYVTGLSNERNYREDVTRNGDEYRSIRFGIKTSENNIIYVEKFGMVRDEITVVRPKTKDQEQDKKRIKWADRKRIPKGYRVFDLSTAIEGDYEGDKWKQGDAESHVAFDGIEYLWNNLQDGDLVYVSGRLNFNEYEGNVSPRFEIGYIAKQGEEGDLDFEDEKFEEYARFELKGVFVDMKEDEEDEEAAFMTIRNIDYFENFVDYRFVVRPNGDEDLIGLREALEAELDFGDVISMHGVIANKVIQEDVINDAPTRRFGGKTNKYKRNTTYVKELQIEYVEDEVEEGKYEPEDFVREEAVKDETKKKSRFGGKKRDDKKEKDDAMGEILGDDEDPFGGADPFAD